MVAAAQEERFTRRKHDPRFPREAVEYCLAEAGIEPSQLDCVAFYEKPHVKFERLLETYMAFAPRGLKSFRQALPLWVRQKLHLPKLIRSELGASFGGEVLFADHHESHAASAFFPSPFEEAAILTLDAVGEWSTSSLGVGRGNRIEMLDELRFPHSIGMLYSAFTYYAGFKVNSGEYKLMGLAPYGRPVYVDRIREFLEVGEDGSIWLDQAYFDYCHGLEVTSKTFHDLFDGPPREPESQITQKEMDLAASVQVVTEEIVLRAAEDAHRRTGLPNLVMAGGVALNCVANGRILREGPFKGLWIQPAAGDAGGALGAALLAWHHGVGAERSVGPSDSQRGSLLGPSFSSDDIELFLDSVGATYRRFDSEPELLDRVARLIEDEKIIGWFQGRMEYGPRALGCRSILGDPRSERMQQTMNLKIKFRESFRPFAPCVLSDRAHEVFEMGDGQESPYMLLVAPVRENLRRQLSAEETEQMSSPDLRVRVSVPRSTLPAITHVDYSARVQTVDEERHGRYARLMRRFEEITDCPVVVNTSFNIRGEPIVCTPEDAFRCFMATHMDVLVLEDCVILKDEQPEALLTDAEDYRAQYALD